MNGTGRLLGVLFGSLGISAGWAVAGPPEVSPREVAPAPNSRSPMGQMANATRVVLSDVVEPGFRDVVLSVVRKPTLTTRSAVESLTCTPGMFEWLLDHPDRTVLAWQRLKVPCVEIKDIGNGKFAWSDNDGSEVVWQRVGRFSDGLIWYATGKVKPSLLTPSVPFKAVVVMSYPKRGIDELGEVLAPTVQAFLQTDSKAAAVVLRILGPTAPSLAEQGAEQLLIFFAAIAKYTYKHPDKSDRLLAPPRK